MRESIGERGRENLNYKTCYRTIFFFFYFTPMTGDKITSDFLFVEDACAVGPKQRRITRTLYTDIKRSHILCIQMRSEITQCLYTDGKWKMKFRLSAQRILTLKMWRWPSLRRPLSPKARRYHVGPHKQSWLDGLDMCPTWAAVAHSKALKVEE